MKGMLLELDRVLRGEATRPDALRGGRLELAVPRFALALIALGMVYGVCMGSYTMWRTGGPIWEQILAAALKVPALYVLTLIVTFPSLYVFNALVGSRLDIGTVFRLLMVSLVVMVAVLASMGPIVAFFGASTSSYPFMKLLNVVVFGISGLLGLGFLLRTLERLSLRWVLTSVEGEEGLPPAGDVATAGPVSKGPLDVSTAMPAANLRRVFRAWVVLFGLVGAQMAWVLRPFLGDPRAPFTWFRPRTSNFFEAVVRTLMDLFQ